LPAKGAGYSSESPRKENKRLSLQEGSYENPGETQVKWAGKRRKKTSPQGAGEQQDERKSVKGRGNCRQEKAGPKKAVTLDTTAPKNKKQSEGRTPGRGTAAISAA